MLIDSVRSEASREASRRRLRAILGLLGMAALPVTVGPALGAKTPACTGRFIATAPPLVPGQVDAAGFFSVTVTPDPSGRFTVAVPGCAPALVRLGHQKGGAT